MKKVKIQGERGKTEVSANEAKNLAESDSEYNSGLSFSFKTDWLWGWPQANCFISPDLTKISLTTFKQSLERKLRRIKQEQALLKDPRFTYSIALIILYYNYLLISCTKP